MHEFEDVSEGGLLPLAGRFAPKKTKSVPLTVRRIFSLMRLGDCKTVLIESITRSKHDKCHNKSCFSAYQTSSESCTRYTELVSRYGYNFLQKECHRLTFFNTSISHKRDLPSLSSENIIGYCIIHQDHLQGERAFARVYVPECFIKINLQEYCPTIYGGATVQLDVLDQPFEISGNYFSEQNNITNCCANAAIKMAFRGHYPQLTAEAINATFGINHSTKTAKTGVESIQIKQAIEKLTPLKTFLIDSQDLPHLTFIKTLYCAIETRLPIILTFKLATNKDSHSVAIVGHTFNKHDWTSYSIKEYLTPRGMQKLKHTSSFLWCNNFIIQDDYLGPHYFISTQTFPVEKKLSRMRRVSRLVKQKLLRINFPIENIWKQGSVKAIIAYPEWAKTFEEYALKVDLYAEAKLRQFIETASGAKKLPDTEMFYEYFYRYYQKDDIIFRTFLVKTEEYQKNLSLLDGLGRDGKIELPECIWLTEISIPELFWVNSAKVGEIVIDPNKLENGDDELVALIRLPNLVYINSGEEKKIFLLDQSQSYSRLLSPKGILSETIKSAT